jgi:predicted nucleotide-binding protein
MKTTGSDAAPGGNKPTRGTKISQADVPSISLQKATRVPTALADNYGSHPTRPIDVAAAVNMTPGSGQFRTMCGAAVGYGLTEGGPNAPQISLTPLGRRVVTPTEVDDDKRALRQAALIPSVAQKFYAKYDGSPLPPKTIAQNVLATFDVPVDRTSAVLDLLIENANYVGFIKTIKDKDYVDTGASIVSDDSAGSADNDSFEEPESSAAGIHDSGPETAEVSAPTEEQSDPPAEPEQGHKNAIFLGHGSNRKPMEQLVKILNEYGIPHKQAVEEANRARPIPQKVADVMRECGAAILIFTADKEYFDKDRNSVWRPSENVSHELGAASVLYGDRIVVFKENGIELPSNFRSVGYIEFEKDRLDEKGIELFRELVSMKILSISVA